MRPATTFPGSRFNRGTNAAWLGVDWVNQSHTTAEIRALAKSLDQQQILHVYAFTSYLKPKGHLNPTYARAGPFVEILRAEKPDLSIQAWIGLPLGYVDLGENAVRVQIAQFCAQLVEQERFDGVHLDPEPVHRNDRDLLELLDEVRRAIGPGATLSIATRRIWPIYSEVAWPLVGQVAWSAGDYREIASRVDQIAVMTYDSALPLAGLYRHWSRFQVIEISRAVEGTGVDLFFGVPTSEEKTWTHWPRAESMTSGLSGTVDGLNDARARPAAVTGVAIYPYWETDRTEWSAYEKLWLGRDATSAP